MEKRRTILRLMLALAAVIILGGGRLTKAAVSYDILSDSASIEKGDVITYQVKVPVKSKVTVHFYGEEDTLRTYMVKFDLSFTNAKGKTVDGLKDQCLRLDDADYIFNFSAGTYTMTLSATGYSSSYAFAITGTPTGKVAAKKLRLNKKSVTMKLNSTTKLKETSQLTAKVTPFYCTQKLRWSSSNKKIATVTQDGLVTARGLGRAVIQVRAGSVTAKCAIKVGSGWLEYNVGKSRKLEPYVRNIVDFEKGSWTTSRPAVVSISDKVFTTKKQGKSMLRFIVNGRTYRLTVYSYDLKTLYPKAQESLKEYWGKNDTPIVKEMGYFTKKPGSIYLKYVTEKYPEQQEEFYACYYQGKYYCGDDAEILIKQGK